MAHHLGTRPLPTLGAALAAGLLLPLLAVLTASPAHAQGTVTVSVGGKGDASGAGITCNESGGPDCSEFYADEIYQECDPELKPPCWDVRESPYVELTAGPDRNGFTFDSWSGCDSVSGRVCALTVTTNTSLTARFRDAQAPSVSSPSPTGVQRGTITLAASASDNSGAVSRVEFRVRGVLVGTDNTAPYSVSFDTASVSDGIAGLRATAIDSSHNSSFAESSITIDNTAPVVSVTGGPDGSVHGPGTTQTWAFTASDATSGVAARDCSVVPVGSPPAFGACTGNTSHSVTSLPDGSYEFAVRARDAGGLTAVSTRGFSIDGTAPALSVTSGPAEASIQPAGSHTWGLSASDAHGAPTLTCGVAPQGSAPAMGPCSAADAHTSGVLGSGTWTFTVRAVDGVGNATTSTRNFTVDAFRPTVTNLAPAAGSRTRDRTPVVRATVKDQVLTGVPGSIDAGDIRLHVDGVRRSFDFAAPRLAWQARRLAYGRHVVKLVVTDQAGNRTTKKWWFKVAR